MNDAGAKEKEDVRALYEKPISEVELWGHVELAPKVSEIMGWKPGTELTGQKVGGLLIYSSSVRNAVFAGRICVSRSFCIHTLSGLHRPWE